MFMMEKKNSVKAPLRTTAEDERDDGKNIVRKDSENDVFVHVSNYGLSMNRLKQKMMWGSGHGCDLFGSFNVASNQGWGIPPGVGLRGGGLNSLNNGTSGWGAPPSNSSAASATGWGAPPGSASVVGSGSSSSGVVGSGQSSVAAATSTSSSSPGGLVNTPANNQQVNPSPANNNHPSGSNQWASTSPNRNTSQNTNGQPTISGSQMNNNPSSNATSAPTSGTPMQMGNQNVNNVMSNSTPNSPMNPGSVGTNPNQNSGPGSTNSSGLITNSGTSSWAQAAGKSLQPANGNNNNTMNNANNPSNTSAISNNPNAMNANSVNQGVTGHGPPMSGITSAPPPGSSGNSSVTSKQIEQLNSMRDALFSHDGWGGQNVNQDSGWDIPGSPEPQHKDLGGMGGNAGSSTGAATWKANVNNGTDLWEANLRNGGAPPPQPATQKAPWGHTPSTNIGGTWGEEDDGADSSNVWTGVPPASNAPGPNGAPPSNSSGGNNNSGQMQWCMNSGPQQPPPQREPPNGMWPNAAPVKKEEWNSNVGRGHGGHDMGRGHDNAPTGWGNNTRGGMNNGTMGVDPNQGMWGKPPQQPPPQPQNQWGGGPPGHIGPGNHGGHIGMKDKPSSTGWDESPPTQRRAVPNIPNYDDGTSLWGNPIPNQPQQPPPPPQQQSRMPPNRGMPNKMESGVGNPMWGHTGGGNRNGWNAPDGPQDGFNSGGGWNDDKNAGGSWGEPPMPPQQQPNSWGKPKTPTNPASGWGDDSLVDTSSWGGTHKNSRPRYGNDFVANGNGNFAKDASRPLKILADLGFKKEDLEMALRSSHMDLSGAIDSIDNLPVAGGGRGGPPMDQSPWGAGPLQPQQPRRGPPPVGPGPDDHFDLSGLGVGPNGPMGMGHPPQQRGAFPNPGGFPGANSIINNVANPSLASINPSLIQKIIAQQQPNPPQPFNTQRGVQPNNTTSPAQLRLLVQQIQMAVQAGYLSSQILQHPLPQQSLYLLNQLLQQIKIFQQVTQAQQQIGKTNSAAALQLSVQITKTKQQINNLHNQIAAQQALHAKQQAQQQQQQQHNHLMAAAAAAAANKPSNDFFNNPPILPNNTGMDPMMSALQGNFGSDFGLGKESGQHQQSRLTQWTKLPSLEKDEANNSGNEFSRAPGPQSNNSSNILKNPSFNLGQSDNTWSSVPSRSGSDGWPTDHPPTANSSSNANPNMNLNDDSNKPNSSVNVNINADSWPSDLVPEFEPGKPWKGTQIMKSVEDDPTLTPGSVSQHSNEVVRSPLSLAAIKENSEIFSKNSPPAAASSVSSDSLVTPLSLSSNTWSFTPTPTSSSSSGMANNMAKLNSTKAVWDDMRPRDIWDYGSSTSCGNAVPGSRPPPGLPKKTGGPTTPVPAASGNVTSGTNSNSFNSYRNNTSNMSWGTNQGSGMHFWLLLRNLTPQIDGSTLKTLCLQHGPLQNFHLYLSHGVALVRYASREEAAKAQNALNNCVLGNTTILAETAGEGDVHNLIQGLNGSAAVNNSQPTSNNAGISSGNNNSRQSSNDNPWNVLRDNSPLWSSSPWGTAGLDAPDRATPSSLNSLLPGDLLGGESA
ncbi:unnamed protein product [Allacma fusca]|uniref:RRM domain-containing protein n=1 Tax=Allacma fusca TaxID=39272 RepID=A0A8J2LHF4_9HEXA|nr:unnamed protein product [Allacma fusca]